jgi:hypothetical protein
MKKIYEKYLGEGKKGNVLNEAVSFITVWQGDHKSSIGWSDKTDDPGGGKAYVLGNIPHNAPFMFDRKEVSKIIKLLKMKNSPLVKD